MADAIEAINVLNFALDGIQQRQQVIANNITNENTPDYQAKVVTFETSLVEAQVSYEVDSKVLQNSDTAYQAILAIKP